MSVALPKMISRIYNPWRGIDCTTEYGKRMTRLSNRIFVEPTTPFSKKSSMILKKLMEEPCEMREDKKATYYPNLPMFHYLTKMLRLHGLFMDEHVVFRLLQDELLILRGKVVYPPIGQGKRAQIRAKKA